MKNFKEKLKIGLIFVGMAVIAYILLYLLRWFMWACYEAGIPM